MISPTALRSPGFIDDGSGNGSPSGILGNVLTVTAVNFGFLGTGCFTTASYNGSFGHNDFTVSNPSTLTTPIVGGPLTYIISPDGTASTINAKVGNIYYLNPPAPPSYTNRTVLVFNPFSFTNNAAIQPGLYDGATLTGQYKILYQMTASNGDNPGLRGRYRLSGSAAEPGISSQEDVLLGAAFCIEQVAEQLLVRWPRRQHRSGGHNRQPESAADKQPLFHCYRAQ